MNPSWSHRAILTALALTVCMLPPLPGQAATLSCAEAAAVAEAGAGIPAGLLLAIGNVETGRADASGKRAPWPWSTQSSGVGRYHSSPETAVAAVQALQATGVQSIDIGCFQINLLHHPRAFPDLASGFDPLVNATAAARFLSALHDEFAAWEPAVAAYHSRTQTLGNPYRDMVLAAWRGAPPPAAANRMWANFRIWGPAGEIGAANQPLPAGAWIRMPGLLITAR